MPHPYARSRSLARRVVLAQAVVTLLVALPALGWGAQVVWGVIWGGGIAVAGSLAFVLPQFGGALVTPERMVRQFYLAGALRWLVVGLGWFLGIAVWKWPFLAMLSGFVATQVASFWTLLKS